MVTRLSALLEMNGVTNFSPITHSAEQARALPGTGHDWAYWEKTDKIFLSKCDELWVLDIPGWNTSVGVMAEIDYFKKLRKPVRMITFSPTSLTAMVIGEGEILKFEYQR